MLKKLLKRKVGVHLQLWTSKEVLQPQSGRAVKVSRRHIAL